MRRLTTSRRNASTINANAAADVNRLPMVGLLRNGGAPGAAGRNPLCPPAMQRTHASPAPVGIDGRHVDKDATVGRLSLIAVLAGVPESRPRQERADQAYLLAAGPAVGHHLSDDLE